MKTVGIICEYNPLHLGHLKQLHAVRTHFGEDTVVICLMSGNYVQRGEPAVMDKSIRAKAAVMAGADLILELPTEIAVSSAESFAAGSVRIMSTCCDALCFGTETMDAEQLMQTAKTLLSSAFSAALKESLATGCSFPAARQSALERLGCSNSLSSPNDILAVEYCKAILSQNSSMEIFPVIRKGNYHSDTIDSENPSATSLRRALLNHKQWENGVPDFCIPIYQSASLHSLEAGERAVLSRLRSMSDAEFEALPYGSEGLWRKLMKASRTYSTLAEIADAVKSKRYTYTRISRMILCAYLGISMDSIGTMPPYIRVLAFSQRGRSVLRCHSEFYNTGTPVSDPYWQAEQRHSDLYGLFCCSCAEAPGQESLRRVYFHKEDL